MTVVELLPHDQSVVTALEAIAGGHPVGFAKNPPGALLGVQQATGPDFYTVWPISGLRDGPSGDPFADVDLIYQINCIGRDADGVRWLQDRIEPALATVAIPGRSVLQIAPEDSGALRPDEDLRPELDGPGVQIVTPRYRISTTPA